MKISFSLMSSSISKQLEEQNLFVENSENFDKCVDSANKLWSEYFLTDKEREKVFKRIFKQIEREVKLC